MGLHERQKLKHPLRALVRRKAVRRRGAHEAAHLAVGSKRSPWLPQRLRSLASLAGRVLDLMRVPGRQSSPRGASQPHERGAQEQALKWIT